MKPPVRTPEEQLLVRDALILPLMIYFIHADMDKIHAAGLHLDIVLTRGLKRIQDDIFDEHCEVKKELKHRGIKIVAERQTATGIEAEYWCRGYRHRMSLHWDIIRAETLRKVNRYTGVPWTEGGA